MRLLLAEDDEQLSEALNSVLQHRGYRVDCVRRGQDARTALDCVDYDLMLLDLGLPDVDGLDVVRDLRQAGKKLPILVITARETIDDRIQGLDLGANDYIVKPFDIRELEARVRAFLRNAQWENQPEIFCGRLALDTTSRQIFLDRQELELTPRESAVLQALIMRVGKLVHKQSLIEQVSSWDSEVTENAVEIVIHRLRKKLESGGVNIRTVRGFGYLLEKPE